MNIFMDKISEKIRKGNGSSDRESFPPAICIRDLYFAYQRDYLLENVNLDIHPREFVCIIGPNGSGKTTLLKLILGLLKPQQGSIHIFGQEPEIGREWIGYVPQHFQLDLSFPATVLEVVMMGLIHKRKWFHFSSSAKKRAQETLKVVGLGSRAGDMFRDLSGGQRQRVLIARALVNQPKILLFDEPTAHVDTVAEQSLMELLKRISQEIAVILVSHDLGFVSQYVDTVVCVNKTVQKHPTNTLTGEIIRELYGRHIELVQHGLIQPQEEHHHG